MRIAIPIWQSRVSPVFDVAGRLLLVDIVDGRETARLEETMAETLLPSKVRRLKDLGVTVLVCGAISRPLAMLVGQIGITVIPWIAGHVDEVLRSYIQDGLPDPRFLMPGCRCRRGGRGRRRRGGWPVAQTPPSRLVSRPGGREEKPFP